MKVDGSIKSLLQGVSQQPPRDRLPGQATEQINMRADPVDGLTRRAPTDLVGILGMSLNVRAWHDFKMADEKKFVAMVTPSSIIVRDLNAVLYTTTVEAGGAYLASAGSFRFYTDEDEDVTYVVNTGVIPKMLPAVKSYANRGPGSVRMGLVQVLGGQYSRVYSILVDGVLRASYKPPDGSTPTDIDKVRTTHIAQRLVEAMAAGAGTTAPDGASSALYSSGYLSSGWTVVRRDDVISIARAGATEFNLSVSDDAGNANFKATTTQVAGTEDLPRMAPHGYVIRVATEVDPEEDVFLMFHLENSDDTTAINTGFGNPGYWQECVAPDTPYKFDLTTMPHLLKYDRVAGSFKVRQGDWADRRVGTLVSNPEPTFVGRPIMDITTFQSRLVLLAGSNVILSRTNRPEDYWYGSAAASSDADPIDVSSTAEGAGQMLAVVPHNRDLVVFSSGGQFVLFGRTSLTSENATLVLTTSFEAELTATPATAGRNVFFATNFGRFTGMREFFTEGSSETNDARPITQHIKEYIRGKATRIAASSTYGMMLMTTTASLNDMYQYQFIWADEQKVQSAWGKMTFSKDVVYVFFDTDLVYLIVKDDNTYYLMRMPLDVQDEAGMDFPVFLDYRFDVSNVSTTFVLPYDWMHSERLLVVQGEDCPNPGMSVPVDTIVYSPSDSGYVVTLKVDMEGGHVVAGVRFRSSYIPTMPLVKDQDGVVVSTGKLKARQFQASLYKTGYIAARILSPYGNSDVIDFNGRLVGGLSNVVGQVALTDEPFNIPFRERTDRAEIEFFSDDYLPMVLLDVDWEGQYHKRGKRISTGG